ncbi:hypothetical protein D0T49_04455 [Paludibacter sp. 221]|nr:hypothetical protein [Paludibacter sp. 221]
MIHAIINGVEIQLHEKEFKQRCLVSPCRFCIMNRLIKRNSPNDCMKYIPDCRAHKREDKKSIIYIKNTHEK